MVDLVRDSLNKIFREALGLDIIFLHKYETEKGYENWNIEWVIEKRIRGDFKPIIIYGFNNYEQAELGKGMENFGAYYLKLPNTIENVKKVINKAKRWKGLGKNKNVEAEIKNYSIQKVRAFKHIFDNVWLSLSANVNNAKKAIEDENRFNESISAFKSERIIRLKDDYKEIEPFALHLGIKDAKQGEVLLNGVIEIIKEIEGNKGSPWEKLDLAFKCIEKIKAVSNILEKAKELERSE